MHRAGGRAAIACGARVARALGERDISKGQISVGRLERARGVHETKVLLDRAIVSGLRGLPGRIQASEVVVLPAHLRGQTVEVIQVAL